MLLRFLLILFTVTIAAFGLKLWWDVFIVGEMYATNNILGNVIVGGIPLWMAIAGYFLYKGYIFLKEELG